MQEQNDSIGKAPFEIHKDRMYFPHRVDIVCVCVRAHGCVSIRRSIVVSLCGQTANEAPSARETA